MLVAYRTKNRRYVLAFQTGISSKIAFYASA
eukprot:SAG11_NODE_11640_length_747_cov_1.177469_1_plen_30_part_10